VSHCYQRILNETQKGGTATTDRKASFRRAGRSPLRAIGIARVEFNRVGQGGGRHLTTGPPCKRQVMSHTRRESKRLAAPISRTVASRTADRNRAAASFCAAEVVVVVVVVDTTIGQVDATGRSTDRHAPGGEDTS
jgi:hypothetical protein